MVENNPLLSQKKFVEYSYHACNQEFEDQISSGVVCASNSDTITYLNGEKTVIGLWWIEQIIIANPDYEEATAMNPQEDQFAYKLYPRREQKQQSLVKMTENKLGTTQLVTLKYQKNYFKQIHKNDTEVE